MSNKYGAKRVFYDGYWFASMVERDRYLVLRSMQEAGEIYGLVVHPKFVILPSFTYWGKRIRAVTYTADFKYSTVAKNAAQDQIVVEDVKGDTAPLTELFNVKWKMVKAQNPLIKFVIVRM